MITMDPGLTRPEQMLIADRGYRSGVFEQRFTSAGTTIIRPSMKGEKPRPSRRFLRPFRQIIESVNQTLRVQLDLERHGGRKPDSIVARVLQRTLALSNPAFTGYG